MKKFGKLLFVQGVVLMGLAVFVFVGEGSVLDILKHFEASLMQPFLSLKASDPAAYAILSKYEATPPTVISFARQLHESKIQAWSAIFLLGLALVSQGILCAKNEKKN